MLLTQFTEGHDLLLLDSVIFNAEQLYRCLNAAGEYQAADIVTEATTMLTSIQNKAIGGASGTLSAALITTGRPGRPRLAWFGRRVNCNMGLFRDKRRDS